MIRFRRPRGNKMQVERFRAIAQVEAYEQHRAGTMSDTEYQRATRVLDDESKARQVYASCNTDIRGGINWEDIITWIKENWVTILRVILSLLIFLEETDYADDRRPCERRPGRDSGTTS